MIESGVAVIVHAVERGGVGIGPFGLVGEGSEDRMRPEKVVESHAGNVGIGIIASCFFPVVLLSGRDSHCERCAMDKNERFSPPA